MSEDMSDAGLKPTGDPVDTVEAERLINAARRMVSDLCKSKGEPGAREWIMSIPVRPDYDPDIVIADGLRAGILVVWQLADARARIAELEALSRDVACVWCGHHFESTLRSQADHLYEHAKVCEKHPLRATLEAVAAAKSEAASHLEALSVLALKRDEALAKLAAWEPVVRAAVGWHDSAMTQIALMQAVDPDPGTVTTTPTVAALIAAVDALPPEVRPREQGQP